MDGQITRATKQSGLSIGGDKAIAIKAGLTESSVRDYISRLIHKGIPLKKERINNKSIVISVPDELKSLATLDNLTRLKQYDVDDINSF